MRDELIKYETAKLAKEKGFKETCQYFYYGKEPILTYIPFSNKNSLDSEYATPTQSLLQRWLREVHGIHIAIEFSNMQNAYFHKVYASTEDLIDIEMKYLTIEPENYIIYATYELALESALLEALNLIP